MGSVYLAHDLFANQTVAVKRMLDSQGDASFRARFLREASLLLQLDHPGIPDILDFLAHPQGDFLVMELIEGVSLADLAEQGVLTEVEILEYTLQVCTLLAYLHDRETPIVHRDVKPANLIRRPDGQIVLVDFGMAREQEAGTKTMVGTLGYAPLEQMQGHPEPRSDLYALGVTMLYLLTGVLPRPLKIPDPAQLRADLSEGTCKIIRRATQGRLSARYSTAQSMRRAVAETLSELTGEPVTSPASPRPVEDEPWPDLGRLLSLTLTGVVLVTTALLTLVLL